MKIHDLFFEQARKTPDHFAVQDDRGRWTYSRLAAEVRKRSNQLVQAGVRKGHIVVLLQANSRKWLRDLLAIADCGAIVLPLHAESKQAELTRLFGIVQPDWRLLEVAEPRPGEAFTMSLDAALVAMNKDSCTGKRVFPMRTVQEVDELLLIGMTSGSTGEPKAYVKSHNTWTAIMDEWSLAFDLQAEERVVAPLSLSYSAQLFPLVHALCTGGEAVTQASFSPKSVLQAQGTCLHLTPAALDSLCSYLEANKRNGSSAVSAALPERLITVGNKLARSLRERVLQLSPGTQIYEYYGSSEMGCVSVVSPEVAECDPDTVGRPFPGVEVTFHTQRTNGKRTEAGDRFGKLYVRSAQTFEGYLGDHSLTESSFKGEWVTSHDLGYWTNERMIRLTGRDREIVKSGGSLISALELESVLGQMPEVLAAAVLRLPDKQRGEIAAACLVLKAGARLETVRKRCVELLPSHKRPRKYVVVKELPKNRNGKLDKAALLRLIT